MQEDRARVASGPVRCTQWPRSEVYQWGGLRSQSTEGTRRPAKVLHDELERLPLDRRGMSAVEPRAGYPGTVRPMRALRSDALRYADSTPGGDCPKSEQAQIAARSAGSRTGRQARWPGNGAHRDCSSTHVRLRLISGLDESLAVLHVGLLLCW